MKRNLLLVLTRAVVLGGLLCGGASAQTLPPLAAIPANGLGRLPIRGHNSWYGYGCTINETIAHTEMDALVSTGLRDTGYNVYLLDDCWSSLSRDGSGNIQPDSTKFPSGMAALASYAHARGLLFIGYATPGPNTCAGYMGSYQHEYQDAATFASWGWDGVKYDWCNADSVYTSAGTGDVTQRVFQLFAQAVRKTGRPMYLSISTIANDFTVGWQAATWGRAAGYNDWRVGTDDFARFGFVCCGTANPMDAIRVHSLWQYHGPGGANDMDYLGDASCPPDGSSAQSLGMTSNMFALEAFFGTNLILGCRPSAMDSSLLTLYKDKELNAYAQDLLMKPATNLSHAVCGSGGSAKCEAWWREVADGYLVLRFTSSDQNETINVNFADFSPAATTFKVRDVTANSDLGTLTGLTGTVGPVDPNGYVHLYHLTPVTSDYTPSAELEHFESARNTWEGSGHPLWFGAGNQRTGCTTNTSTGTLDCSVDNGGLSPTGDGLAFWMGNYGDYSNVGSYMMSNLRSGQRYKQTNHLQFRFKCSASTPGTQYTGGKGIEFGTYARNPLDATNINNSGQGQHWYHGTNQTFIVNQWVFQDYNWTANHRLGDDMAPPANEELYTPWGDGGALAQTLFPINYYDGLTHWYWAITAGNDFLDQQGDSCSFAGFDTYTKDKQADSFVRSLSGIYRPSDKKYDVAWTGVKDVFGGAKYEVYHGTSSCRANGLTSCTSDGAVTGFDSDTHPNLYFTSGVVDPQPASMYVAIRPRMPIRAVTPTNPAVAVLAGAPDLAAGDQFSVAGVTLSGGASHPANGGPYTADLLPKYPIAFQLTTNTLLSMTGDLSTITAKTPWPHGLMVGMRAYVVHTGGDLDLIAGGIPIASVPTPNTFTLTRPEVPQPVFVASGSAHGSGAGSTATVASLDCTGATTVIAAASYATSGPVPTISDSGSHQWCGSNGVVSCPGTTAYANGTSGASVKTFYLNAGGVLTVNALADNPSLYVACFKNVAVASSVPLYDSVVGVGAYNSAAPLEYIPSTSSQLVVAAVSGTGTLAVDSGFAITQQMPNGSGYFGGGLAYKIKTDYASEAPVWTGGTNVAESMLGFGQNGQIIILPSLVLTGVDGTGWGAANTDSGYAVATSNTTNFSEIRIDNINQPNVLPISLPAGTVSAAYSQTLTAYSFSGTVTWSLLSGALPTGLSGCTSGTGTICAITGTPSTTSGSPFSFTIRATDGTSTVDTPYTVTVNPAPSLGASSPLPAVTSGASYSQSLSASGGTAPLTCALTAGSLAGSGLTLNSVCTVTGTAAAAATYSFTATVTDANGIAVGKAFSVTVNSGGGTPASSFTGAFTGKR